MIFVPSSSFDQSRSIGTRPTWNMMELVATSQLLACDQLRRPWNGGYCQEAKGESPQQVRQIFHDVEICSNQTKNFAKLSKSEFLSE
jgi:hypothetical protein